ncbi:hypothetical protein [Streptomyces sp. x-45]|uniref:hypothetical protein n=1 Tax=Streptomyces sp. x-45 TaxID=2789281 RepID=UPI0022C4EC83|nr:hypothetical protein [Streptomyces diastatochromogenes]
MSDVWVLTNPADSSKRQVIRADVITNVIGGKEQVHATWTGRQMPVTLVEWSTKFDKRDPLPAGFHIAFLQALDEAKRQDENRDQVIYGEWIIDQQQWKWLVKDVEDLDPKQF